ncbi:hypothetical protein BKA64DRAFT_681415 [Cadophora sp. MPI-SDFR-AT-0126]|nr:hypothetical protein BKA64DRAFT_681415 [Leotiomycetes sp. MPI-SDFR-AT-0126]
MGYVGTVCQICGVAFAIARIRGAHEPYESAWDYYGSDYIVGHEICEGTSGCQSFQREDDGQPEHLAGPGCYSESGYSGYRLSLGEMSGCRSLQCMIKKDEDWEVESDDQEFEKTSKYFLTGLSDGSPDEAPATDFNPVRHGVQEVWVSNTMDDLFEDNMGFPFHPTCFEIFKRVSIERLGHIDVHGLWAWRDLEGTYKEFFEQFPRAFEVSNGDEQWWYHEPGNEFLAANPVEIPGFSMLLKKSEREFIYEGGKKLPYNASRGVFTFAYKTDRDTFKGLHKTPPPRNSSDIFSRLPNELRYMVIAQLSAKDIANLRLVTPAYRQLPFSVFSGLISHEMPWLWEAHGLPVGNTDWYFLYTKIKFAWQNLKGVRNRKRIWKDVNEIVNRIEKYRKEGKISGELEEANE